MPFLSKSRRSGTVKPPNEEETGSVERKDVDKVDSLKEIDLYNELVKKLKQKQELLRRLKLVKAYKSRVNFIYVDY
jgi:hypothetical protein